MKKNQYTNRILYTNEILKKSLKPLVDQMVQHQRNCLILGLKNDIYVMIVRFLVIVEMNCKFLNIKKKD